MRNQLYNSWAESIKEKGYFGNSILETYYHTVIPLLSRGNGERGVSSFALDLELASSTCPAFVRSYGVSFASCL